MQKLITVAARRPGNESAVFQQDYLERLAPLAMAQWVGLRRYIVNLVDVALDPDAGAPEPPYDVVTEAWFDTLEDFLEPGRRYPSPAVAAEVETEFHGATARAFVYHVAERVQLDDGQVPIEGARSPGVKAIYLVRRAAGLSSREAAERWRKHAPLAVKHHAGMSKYVQNGVIASLTPGAPRVDGVAVLHFPTLEDLRQRMYDSEAGRAAITADAATLVSEATPLYCGEYVLRA